MRAQKCLFLHKLMKVCKLQCINSKKLLNFYSYCLLSYFGRQCAIGCRKDNPSIRDFDYNKNTIKSQFLVCLITGNFQSNDNNIMCIENNL